MEEAKAAAMGLKSPIREVQWMAVNSISDNYSESTFEDSIGTSSSSSSSSSIDMIDDASSSSSSFGPLYELSQLMAQLPIKRGLSKYYEGKSQSFGRLGSVMSVEDLAKEGNYSSHNKRMKSCKSLNGRIRSSFGPKATIKKKSYSTRPILSSPLDTNTDLIVATCTSPIYLQTNF